MDDKPVLDEGALDRLRDWGGEKLVTQMIRLYIENSHTRLSQIDAGLEPGGELRDAELAAHSLKSSAANVGAARVRAISAEIEDAAEREETDSVRELRDRLAKAISEAEDRIRSYMPGSGN